MRQVPTYLIIGNGRLAKHLSFYLRSLSLPVGQWSRQESTDTLRSLLLEASHVLILIKDDAIATFASEHLSQSNVIKIHCSGSLIIDGVYGAHPLMTFAESLFPLNTYLNIPFVIDERAPNFAELLPGLSNPHVRIAESKKAKYHALCSMSGNFTALLWQHMINAFENELNLPRDIINPYLNQQMQNLMHDPDNALTGPLVRNDVNTIRQHLSALENDPYQVVYHAFLEAYQFTHAK